MEQRWKRELAREILERLREMYVDLILTEDQKQKKTLRAKIRRAEDRLLDLVDPVSSEELGRRGGR